MKKSSQKSIVILVIVLGDMGYRVIEFRNDMDSLTKQAGVMVKNSALICLVKWNGC